VWEGVLIEWEGREASEGQKMVFFDAKQRPRYLCKSVA
jgi:hypothetical protein